MRWVSPTSSRRQVEDIRPSGEDLAKHLLLLRAARPTDEGEPAAAPFDRYMGQVTEKLTESIDILVRAGLWLRRMDDRRRGRQGRADRCLGERPGGE